jgi:hypothetical protein
MIISWNHIYCCSIDLVVLLQIKHPACRMKHKVYRSKWFFLVTCRCFSGSGRLLLCVNETSHLVLCCSLARDAAACLAWCLGWSYIAWSEVGSNFHLFLLSFSLHSFLTKSRVNARRGNRTRHILLTNKVSSRCKQGGDRVGHGFVYTPPFYSTKTISGHVIYTPYPNYKSFWFSRYIASRVEHLPCPVCWCSYGTLCLDTLLVE